ncbi:MAG: hypothetical protein FGM25_06445 [Mycobacterium sp.]|nr:hypothetical protein [Mycobacterium sp.]
MTAFTNSLTTARICPTTVATGLAGLTAAAAGPGGAGCGPVPAAGAAVVTDAAGVAVAGVSVCSRRLTASAAQLTGVTMGIR